jgi:hypothetical protein
MLLIHSVIELDEEEGYIEADCNHFWYHFWRMQLLYLDYPSKVVRLHPR